MSLLQATPKQKLRDLINLANPNLPVPVTADNLYFGKAKANADGLSTDIPVVAVLAEEYTGYKSFNYRRLNLTTMFDGSSPVLRTIGDTSLVKMLPIINKALGIDLTEEDVVDVGVSSLRDGEQTNIDITAAVNSPGYTGNVRILYIKTRPNFGDAFKNRVLNVLTYPIDPSLSSGSVGMLMYNWDFTIHKSRIALRGNNWSSINTVRDALSRFGFVGTDWPNAFANGVSDYATSAYPKANKSFDRVIVQRDVVVNYLGQTYRGDALFHYNNVL